MLFEYNLNPTLLKIWIFEIRFYGLVFAIGFLAAYILLNRYRKKGYLNISKDDLDNYIIYLIIGIVVGARIFHLFWDLPYYLSSPLKIFAVWEGGLAFHGGLVGALAASYYFCKKKSVPFWKLADILVLPAALFLAFGRIANFVNGELWGPATSVPWCVEFQEVCRHPYQLYEAVERFFIFFILIVLHNKKSKSDYKDGFIFWSFILLMGIGRFVLDFWREEFRIIGLSLGQHFSLVMIIAGVYVLVKYYKIDKYA